MKNTFRTFFLLVFVIYAVRVSAKMNDDMVIPKVVADTHLSKGLLEAECRLKMSLIAWQLVVACEKGQYEYPSDLSWLNLESTLPLVYIVSEDRKSYLLTCAATHHEQEGAGLCPLITENGCGLGKRPLDLKAPFLDYESLPLREFLGISRFNGRYAVQKIGKFNVLVLGWDENGEVTALNLMALNPDNDLKNLYGGFPMGKALGEEDSAAILRKYRVEDPFVLERLKPTWDPYSSPPEDAPFF